MARRLADAMRTGPAMLAHAGLARPGCPWHSLEVAPQLTVFVRPPDDFFFDYRVIFRQLERIMG